MSVALKKPQKRLEKIKILKKLRLGNNHQVAYVADHPITLDEFCDLVDEDDDVELIDGVILEKMATQYAHEDLFRFLFSIMAFYADKYKLGIILGSRTLVQITTYKGRLPDILFVNKERENIIEEKRLMDAPDLVIEILSPSDRQLETMQLISNYEQTGVKEFWIIDQPRKQMQAFIMDEKTKKFVPMQIEGTILRSSVLRGFWINTDWLWQKPLPSVLEVFKEIAGDEM
jgi:Uma2 family endonuclease